MKSTNFGPAPRTMKDAQFCEAGCAIERPAPHNRRANGWKWATWALLILLALLLLSTVGHK